MHLNRSTIIVSKYKPVLTTSWYPFRGICNISFTHRRGSELMVGQSL